MTKRAPVETKVVAATGSAAAGAATSTFVIWLLGVLVWGAPDDADHAARAVLSVPAPVSVVLALGITGGLTWIGSYLAHHSPRKEDAGLGAVDVLLIVLLVLVIIAVLVWLHGHVNVR